MKYELKIEFNDSKSLKKTIEKSYFESGSKGKLIGKSDSLKIKSDDVLFVIFKGMNNSTIKITNEKLIDGVMRCVIDETPEEINLFPINNYCIVEQEKYSFY